MRSTQIPGKPNICRSFALIGILSTRLALTLRFHLYGTTLKLVGALGAGESLDTIPVKLTLSSAI